MRLVRQARPLGCPRCGSQWLRLYTVGYCYGEFSVQLILVLSMLITFALLLLKMQCVSTCRRKICMAQARAQASCVRVTTAFYSFLSCCARCSNVSGDTRSRLCNGQYVLSSIVTYRVYPEAAPHRLLSGANTVRPRHPTTGEASSDVKRSWTRYVRTVLRIGRERLAGDAFYPRSAPSIGRRNVGLRVRPVRLAWSSRSPQRLGGTLSTVALLVGQARLILIDCIFVRLTSVTASLRRECVGVHGVVSTVTTCARLAAPYSSLTSSRVDGRVPLARTRRIVFDGTRYVSQYSHISGQYALPFNRDLLRPSGNPPDIASVDAPVEWAVHP